MHFHYMAMPKHKNPCPRGHKMYNFGKPLFGNYHPLHVYTQFVWSMPMSGEEKKFYINFSVFTQKFSFLGVGVITKNHNALSIKMCHYMDKWHLRNVTMWISHIKNMSTCVYVIIYSMSPCGYVTSTVYEYVDMSQLQNVTVWNMFFHQGRIQNHF